MNNKRNSISKGFHRFGILSALALIVVMILANTLSGVFLRIFDGIPEFIGGVTAYGALGLIVYGIVRAIGWVINGFMS